MLDHKRRAANVSLSLILLLYLHTTVSIEAKKDDTKCPLGFKLAYTNTNQPICYLLKSRPERITDKFENCSGNIFTWRLYDSLTFEKFDKGKLWTDYKSLYAGGIFVDWSYTASTGQYLDTTYDVNRNPYSVDEELCVVADPKSNFTAVECDELNYRYCFLKPYSIGDTSGCEALPNGLRFWGPKPTCLAFEGGRGSRYTWEQAKQHCERKNSSLLSQGWRYANNWTLPYKRGLNRMYPLNIVMKPDFSLWWQNDNAVEIPQDEWHFKNVTQSTGTLGATNGTDWYLVNSSVVFYNVLCEKPVEIRHVRLTVSIKGEDGLLTLTVNDTIPIDDILCFTDSSGYYPQAVSLLINPKDPPNVYTLKSIKNGYYWCTHKAYNDFYIAESNKTLFVKAKEDVKNVYAVRIKDFDRYKPDIIGTLLDKTWKRKIEDYVFYSNEYFRAYTDVDLSYKNDTILDFRKSEYPRARKHKDIVEKVKLKRLYLNAQTALLHVELEPGLRPVRPGLWEGIVIEYMKPVYYCDDNFSLGTSITTSDCKVYTCIGDYNEGVQTVVTGQEECYTPVGTVWTAMGVTDGAGLTDGAGVSDGPPPVGATPLTPSMTPARMDADTTTMDISRVEKTDSESSEESYNMSTKRTVITEIPTTTEEPYEVSTPSEELTVNIRPPKPIPPTTITPPPTDPPTRPPPDLNDVMDELEHLLHNNTDPVMMADIQNAFTQVDEILQLAEVEIPGDLLHLLDELGARIDLNGSYDVTTVRENIALVVADALDSAPVIRGLKIAQRDADVFTDDAFQIIRDNINNTHLSSEASEVVVVLPESVSESRRRVSFVVFRNDRAFSGDGASVNSRVLSVNIDNTTTFHDGEVIDIHLQPLQNELERNQSRACAYWHFDEDGSGRWSQDGCTFIPADSSANILDTCRCTHLTHFAEILVPRTTFSQENETALEIITVIGCLLSIVGLLFVGLTAMMFRTWRRDYSNKIWLQLSVSILILSVMFLIVVFVRLESNGALCTLTGVALHYSVLSSFCWMLVAAVLSYRRLVTVFTRDASHKLLRAAAFAWGAPCAVIGVLLSINPQAYEAPFEEQAPSGAFCYPSGLALWLAVYGPIALMLLANWTLFALIVRSVFASRRIQRHGDTNEALRCASVSCLLVFLFGLPWIFGLFSFNVVAAYFFTILATFQGFVLFIFFVLGNKKTRDLWLNKLKIKQTRKIPVTSSTYTNRSTGAVVQHRPNQSPSVIEANASKPKSLSSSDNSRFS